MSSFANPRVEAFLDNHEAYVAAEVRTLMRSIEDRDNAGVDASLTRIHCYLENWLLPRLLESDQRWQTGVWWIDGFAEGSEAIFPNRFRMFGSAYMCLNHDPPPPPQADKFHCAQYEPIDFEIELGPSLRYCFRFGDDRSLAEKDRRETLTGELFTDRNWAIALYRNCSEAEWKSSRPALEQFTKIGTPYDDRYNKDDDYYSSAKAVARFAHDTATCARLLIRADMANDAEAYEICLLHLRHQLLASLSYHLRAHSPDGWHIQQLCGALPDLQGSTRVILRDSTRVIRHSKATPPEPVEFDIELCPQTGEMLRYTYSFANEENGIIANPAKQLKYQFQWQSLS